MTFRQFQRLTAGQLNKALAETGAQAGEAAAAPYATAAAASATAAASSASAAATSATAADTAVTAATGPILLTSVGGTATAFTATASHAPTTGRSYWLDAPATNTGTCTLAINGGTARSIRQADGTQLVAGMLRSGRRYLLVYSASNTFIVLGVASISYFFNQVNLIRSSGVNVEFRVADTDAQPWSSLQFISDGRVIFRAGGDGTTIGAQVLEIQTDGDVRALVGRFLDNRSSALYSAYNPPAVNDTAREIAASVAWGPWWETPHEAVGITSTEPYSVSGGDLGRHIRIAVASAWIDFETMPLNTSIIVDNQSAGSGTLYSGYSGTLWRNTAGTRLTIPAGSVVHVIKGQSDIIAATLYGTAVSSSATAVPTYSRAWAFGPGQSWAKRQTKNAARGIQRKMGELSLSRDVMLIQDVAAGASALIIGAPSDVNNYWWEPGVGPGPNATAMRDAVLAAPASPGLSDCIVMYGLNDLSIFASTGSSTPAIWTQAQIDLQAWLRTQLGLAALRFWICPLPSQDLGTFDETKWYAMRRAQLEVVLGDANTFRGPDYYDLPRPYGDRHHAYLAQAEHGARVARFITREVDALSNYLGPKIISFARSAAKTYVVTIDYGTGVAVRRPTVPAGFAIMPAAGLFATPLTVAPGGYTWGTSGSNITLTITTTTDDASADLAYPYGSAWEMSDPSRIMRAQDPDTGEWLPLQTYHPTV